MGTPSVSVKWQSPMTRVTALRELSSQPYLYFIVIGIWRLFQIDQMEHLRYYLACWYRLRRNQALTPSRSVFLHLVKQIRFRRADSKCVFGNADPGEGSLCLDVQT